jgi:hypothetical protein
MNTGCDLRLHGMYDIGGQHTDLYNATFRV